MISSAGHYLLSLIFLCKWRVEDCGHFAVKMKCIAQLEQKRRTTKELPVICRFSPKIEILPAFRYSRDSIQWTAIQWTILRILSSPKKAIEWTFFHVIFIFHKVIESFLKNSVILLCFFGELFGRLGCRAPRLPKLVSWWPNW